MVKDLILFFNRLFPLSTSISSARKMTGCGILSLFVHFFATNSTRRHAERPPVLLFTGVAVSAGAELPARVESKWSAEAERVGWRNRREKARVKMAGRNFGRHPEFCVKAGGK
jgi:hypothetical protein